MESVGHEFFIVTVSDIHEAISSLESSAPLTVFAVFVLSRFKFPTVICFRSFASKLVSGVKRRFTFL
jgi:hypothetical protein